MKQIQHIEYIILPGDLKKLGIDATNVTTVMMSHSKEEDRIAYRNGSGKRVAFDAIQLTVTKETEV